MHVSAILKTKQTDLVTTTPDERIAATVALLAKYKIGAVLVLDPAGQIAGILSERDVVRGLGQSGAAVLDQPNSSLMTRRVVACAPDDTIDSVMVRMTAGRFRHMPVLDGGRLVGIISIGDVVKFRLDEYSHEVESLRDYVAGGF